MIKIEELRIGNWVNYQEAHKNKDGTLIGYVESSIKVTLNVLILIPDRINIDGIPINPEVVGPNDLKIYGIPLTPEILEATGFKMEDNNWLSIEEQGVNITFEINMNNSEKEEWNPNEISGRYLLNGVWINNKLTYVHQLQNLYYSLTGQELEINLHAVA